MIRVLLADDQLPLRSGFRALLDLEDDIEVMAEAADGEQCLTLVTRQMPDVALIDIQIPLMDGMEATRRIAADPALEAQRGNSQSDGIAGAHSRTWPIQPTTRRRLRGRRARNSEAEPLGPGRQADVPSARAEVSRPLPRRNKTDLQRTAPARRAALRQIQPKNIRQPWEHSGTFGFISRHEDETTERPFAQVSDQRFLIVVGHHAGWSLPGQATIRNQQLRVGHPPSAPHRYTLPYRA